MNWCLRKIHNKKIRKWFCRSVNHQSRQLNSYLKSDCCMIDDGFIYYFCFLLNQLSMHKPRLRAFSVCWHLRWCIRVSCKHLLFICFHVHYNNFLCLLITYMANVFFVQFQKDVFCIGWMGRNSDKIKTFF